MSERHRRLCAAALALAITAALAAAAVYWFGGSIGPSGSPAASAPRRPDAYCGTLPPQNSGTAPQLAHSGTFLDPPYAYRVSIPAGLVGYSSAASPRGFGIILSQAPRATLTVDAVYDVFYDLTAAGVHFRDVGAVRLHDILLSNEAQPFTLDGTAGGRYRMRVQCAGNPQVYIHDDIIVVRNREIYRLDLQSVPRRYAGDAQLLEAMAHSWRWVPVPVAP